MKKLHKISAKAPLGFCPRPRNTAAAMLRDTKKGGTRQKVVVMPTPAQTEVALTPEEFDSISLRCA